MTNNWPGLPPIDLDGWAGFQKKRLQDYGKERIAGLGAVASDWGSEAQRRIDEITGRVGGAAAGIQAALPGGAGWEADLDRIRQEAQVSEAQFPTPEPTGPAGFTLPQTGTPEGEAITSALAETATRETPGGAFMTNVARNVTGNLGPMTAETPVENVAGMAGLALQNVGAPLPGRWAGRAFAPGVVQEAGARAVAEAIPGGQTSVLEGAEIPPYVPFLGGQTLTKDTPVLGGLTTPDELLPLAAGAFDPEDLVGLGNRGLRATDGAAGVTGDSTAWARNALDDLARRYGTPPQEALGYRVGGPPTGPSAPGAGMTQEQMAQRVREAEDAIHLWQGEQTPEYDYVARLLRAGQEGEALPQGTTDWSALVESGRLDPDALNRALIAYREEGLSKPEALARGIGSMEERAANLQIGAAAGGVRDPSGLTTGLLNKAIADLAEGGRPFVTQSEAGAFKAGRNVPPDPAGRTNAWEYVDKNGRSQWLSTPYEVLFAKQLDANPDVAYWAQSSPEAVMETTVRHGGTPKVFTPDFIVVGTDGRIQVVEIKNTGAYKQVAWRVPEKLREAEEFFTSKGVGFSIFVEDQLGRVAAGKARPEDFLPDANGRSGVVNGFFVENEEGTKIGRFDADAARGELVRRLREAGGAWDLNELGYLSGRHPLTQEEYDEVLASTHWPAWSGRLVRGTDPNRGPAPITAVQRRNIIAAGPGGVHPAEGGYGRTYTAAYPVRPEQGGYDPRWTPHRAHAEFNERQRRKGAPSIATDAVETYPQMLRQVEPIRAHWAGQVADGQHGMSIDPVNGAFGVPGRYAVSIYPDIGLEFEGKFDQVHPDRLAMFMAEAEPILKQVPGSRVGVWYDSSEDTTFLDISVGVDSLKRATDLGQQMSQKAIFDSATKQDIKLRYAGYALGEAPPPPPRQEQNDAIRTFARAAARSQPRGAAVPGAEALRGAGGVEGPAGAGLGGRAGRLAGGIPGAATPGPAGPAGPSGEGLGGLEQGGVGPAGAEPFGTYPPPVPYESATDTGGRAAAGAPSSAGEASGLAAGRDGEAGGDWRSALDSALASVQPYGAARTGGERTFDVATGTVGGITSAATAEEDATWQERAKRFALGAAAGSLVGPTARGALGQVAGRSVNNLGAAAGAAGSGTRAPGLGTRLGRVGPSDIPSIMASLPLASPSSLGANLTGGAIRTLERVLGKALEGRPIEALVDAATMAKTVPGALKRAGGNIVSGPTAKAPGLTGAPVKDDLSTRAGILPGVLSGGVRVNAATDEFWRELNAAGAGAAARRRGMAPMEAADYRNAAGDFATFGGGNTQVAKKLTEMKASLHDPDAGMLDKSIAWGVTAMAPYIMMPERLLRAAIGTMAPVENVTKAVQAFRKGDKTAARELAGRAAVAIPAWVALAQLHDQGALTGPPPEDADERRRLEAQGVQWETVEVPGGGKIPLRYLGSFGQSASVFASIADAAKKAEADGADPGAVFEARANELFRWTLEESYLSDLVAFGEDVGGGRGVQSLRRTAAGAASRFTAPVAGVLNAADPYEREAVSFPEMVALRGGARGAVPTRIDPTTGEPQRRRGSGWTRYWGERGSEQAPEAQELARRGLQPRTFGPTEEYAGTRQTPEQRRLLQQAFGSETGKALRETTASKAYQQADEEGKEDLLRASLRRAAEEADIVAGERVGRDAKSKAQLEWQAVPRYEDVKGTPDEVRRLNARVRRAKAELAAAIKADPKQGEQKFLRERREDYRLADRRAVDADDLRAAREKIEAKYGVELS